MFCLKIPSYTQYTVHNAYTFLESQLLGMVQHLQTSLFSCCLNKVSFGSQIDRTQGKCRGTMVVRYFEWVTRRFGVLYEVGGRWERIDYLYYRDDYGRSWNPPWCYEFCALLKNCPSGKRLRFLAWERILGCLWGNPRAQKVISPLSLSSSQQELQYPCIDHTNII